jgi:hypothetical protein
MRHSRAGGNPVVLNKGHYVLLDSRLRGNDGSSEDENSIIGN